MFLILLVHLEKKIIIQVPWRYTSPVAVKTNLPILHDSDISEHGTPGPSSSYYFLVISKKAEIQISNYPQLLRTFAVLT